MNKLYHKLSNTTATPSGRVTHPDGLVLVRLNDHWFFLKDCDEAP